MSEAALDLAQAPLSYPRRQRALLILAGGDGIARLFDDPPLLPKLSALSWTCRPGSSALHIGILNCRAMLELERPVRGDTAETLTRLLKRAAMELPWPDLPMQAEDMFQLQMMLLTRISRRRPSRS
jgi:hypothetical protein